MSHRPRNGLLCSKFLLWAWIALPLMFAIRAGWVRAEEPVPTQASPATPQTGPAASSDPLQLLRQPSRSSSVVGEHADPFSPMAAIPSDAHSADPKLATTAASPIELPIGKPIYLEWRRGPEPSSSFGRLKAVTDDWFVLESIDLSQPNDLSIPLLKKVPQISRLFTNRPTSPNPELVTTWIPRQSVIRFEQRNSPPAVPAAAAEISSHPASVATNALLASQAEGHPAGQLVSSETVSKPRAQRRNSVLAAPPIATQRPLSAAMKHAGKIVQAAATRRSELPDFDEPHRITPAGQGESNEPFAINGETPELKAERSRLQGLWDVRFLRDQTDDDVVVEAGPLETQQFEFRHHQLLTLRQGKTVSQATYTLHSDQSPKRMKIYNGPAGSPPTEVIYALDGAMLILYFLDPQDQDGHVDLSSESKDYRRRMILTRGVPASEPPAALPSPPNTVSILGSPMMLSPGTRCGVTVTSRNEKNQQLSISYYGTITKVTPEKLLLITTVRETREQTRIPFLSDVPLLHELCTVKHMTREVCEPTETCVDISTITSVRVLADNSLESITRPQPTIATPPAGPAQP